MKYVDLYKNNQVWFVNVSRTGSIYVLWRRVAQRFKTFELLERTGYVFGTIIKFPRDEVVRAVITSSPYSWSRRYVETQ